MTFYFSCYRTGEGLDLIVKHFLITGKDDRLR